MMRFYYSSVLTVVAICTDLTGLFFSNGKRCEGVPARGIGSIHAHPYWVGWEDASLRRHGNIWQLFLTEFILSEHTMRI
ncbi:hypothetical protein OUZ56_022313 [Daphnia magna]|uniref:Secreted protein n=1 Tax=Daphnia magna TaxID=35525 RepID=A0ABR0AW58_9CRUS|nr:hypothetical protein OUZ56_022313 [Daphnia magna]